MGLGLRFALCALLWRFVPLQLVELAFIFRANRHQKKQKKLSVGFGFLSSSRAQRGILRRVATKPRVLLVHVRPRTSWGDDVRPLTQHYLRWHVAQLTASCPRPSARSALALAPVPLPLTNC